MSKWTLTNNDGEPTIYPPLGTPTTKSPSTKSGMSTTSVNRPNDSTNGNSYGNTSEGDTSAASTAYALGKLEGGSGEDGEKAEIAFSKGRRFFLLFLFSVAQYLDIASRASALVFIGDISRDLDISYETSTWILNSYGVTFGSFLLLWGKASDLYSAKPVFTIGFLISGGISIIISFMTDQYAFYVFRALYGISAAATIPSAFRLILAVFPPGEVQMALAMFGVSGALANATGLLIGGVFGLIDAGGQMSGWRWFFRGIAMISIPFALVAHLLLPGTKSTHPNVTSRWKYLDLPGSFLILTSLMLLNVGLTLGASRGWGTVDFIVPFVLAWPVAISFFIFESRVHPDKAVLPMRVWKVRNMVLMCFLGLFLFSSVALPLVERYQEVFGESAIKSAIRMLPQGLAMCIAVIIASPVIKKITNMRIPATVCFICAGLSFIPYIYGDGAIGHKYWRYYVPAFIIGSIFVAGAFIAVNITILTSVPSSMSGTAGALFQVCVQTGVIIAYSIQAGLLTIHAGSISNFKNVQISYWFLFGWAIFCGILVAIFYKSPPKTSALGDDEKRSEGSVEEIAMQRTDGRCN